MRLIIILAMTWAIPAVAAPPKLHRSVSTSGRLAISRLPAPLNQSVRAMPLCSNFCNGFAQGVVQTERLDPGGSKNCLPTPAPKRSETMKQFVTWVMADTARKEEGASAGFIRFMSERYPCNKG